MSEVLKRRMRCAVYTRKSTDEGLDQEYNSIDAQRDAGHAYIASQRAEGWIPVADDYDDPAFSGGNMDRLALKRRAATWLRRREPPAGAQRARGQTDPAHIPALR